MNASPWFSLVVVILAIAYASLGSAPAFACEGDRDRRDRSTSVSISVDDDTWIARCSDIRVQFEEGLMTARRERTLDLPANRTFTVRTGHDGGIRVQPAGSRAPSILVCHIAGAESEQRAQAILDSVRLDAEDGELDLGGRRQDGSVVYVVINAGESSDLKVEVENGEITIVDTRARISARTTNGPITIRDSAGTIDAHTRNGPISFRGASGKIELAAKNGPLELALTAPSWDGEGLRASTRNGPIALQLPDELETGVRLESSGNAPFACEARACAGDIRSDDSRAIELGPSPVRLDISTRNGPMLVSARSKLKASRRSRRGY